MNKCSICEKPIPEPATTCSSRCMMEANQRGQARIVSARSSFTKSMLSMMNPDTSKLLVEPEVPMFYVKHHNVRNRIKMHQSLVLAFDNKGVAAVKNVGDNRRLAEGACLASNGLMTILEPEVQVSSELVASVLVAEPSVKVEPPPVEKVAAVEVKVEPPPAEEPAEEEEEEDPVVEVLTSASTEEPASMSSKQAPPMKKVTKKAPGKKSSK